MSTTIEDIKKQNIKNSLKKGTNWRGFSYLSLLTFLLVLFIGILGSNFIYITSLTPESMNALFPTKDTDYFDESVLKGGGGVFDTSIPLSSAYNCDMKSKMNILNRMVSILPSKEFPYSIKKKSSILESFLQKIKNWFALTCAGSFIFSREILKMWLKLFSKKSIFGNDTVQLLCVAPLNLWVGSGITILVGLISTLMSLYNSGGISGFILGFIFLYNFLFMAGIAVIQSILFSLTFLLLPLILDFKKVMSIFHCNIPTLSTLFGLFTCITAIFTFDAKSSSIYVIAFTLISIITFFIGMAG
jgi:hypothetical protein